MTFTLGRALKTTLYDTETAARTLSKSAEGETPPIAALVTPQITEV